MIRLLTHIGSVYLAQGRVAPGMERLAGRRDNGAQAPDTGFPVVVKEGQILGLIASGKLSEAEVLAHQIIGQQRNRGGGFTSARRA